MRKNVMLFFILFIAGILYSQPPVKPPQSKIMTLGVFHFTYPNLDVVKVDDNKKISVLDEPYKTQILTICKAIEQYKPTIIAVEHTPDQQQLIDSLYSLYRSDNFKIGKNESFQLGFRIGRNLNLSRIYCVDDRGRHYESIEAIFNDKERLSKFEHYYLNSGDSVKENIDSANKISNIVDILYKMNSPEVIKKRLAVYLQHPFKYEEKEGDFTGVDFETGRWYNRNLRIFRNIQRLSGKADERILLIIGGDHLNLLNLFFDASNEFELISPLPYLEKADSLLNKIQIN